MIFLKKTQPGMLARLSLIGAKAKKSATGRRLIKQVYVAW
jgi:hypothetical protein